MMYMLLLVSYTDKDITIDIETFIATTFVVELIHYFSPTIIFFYYSLFTCYLLFLAVKLQPEHHVTIEHGQDNPNGPELEPVDQSYIGRNVVINKSKKGDKPMERKK